MSETPNITDDLFPEIDRDRLLSPATSSDPPRILILYGSLRAGNQTRILGRWMRLLIIPYQSSIPKALQEFDESAGCAPRPFTTASST